jgi:uncharacterized protein YkwD
MLARLHQLLFSSARGRFFFSLVRHKRMLIVLLVLFSLLSGIGQGSKNSKILSLHSDLLQKQSIAHAFTAEFNNRASLTQEPQLQVQVLGIGQEKYVSPTPTPTATPPSIQENQWGVARQVGAHTWTIQVTQDSRNATPQEIFAALNSYRQKHGVGTLSWNDTLAQFAQSRAAFFTSKGTLDDHAGFLDYVNHQDGFHKLGFASLGENSSIGYTLEGVHLIEWVYGGDKPHDDNQLNNEWLYVGIGSDGTATDLIFGGRRL